MRRRALSSTVQENLTGVRVVRAFGREKYEIDRFDEKIMPTPIYGYILEN